MGGHIQERLFLPFQVFLFGDISIGPDPHCDGSLGITHRDGSALVPAIDSIRTPKAVFNLPGFSALYGVLPAPDRLLDILGMDELRPSPIFDRFKREASKRHPLGIKVID